MSLESLDYYAVLEIAPSASQDDIFKAYKQAQATYSLENSEIYKIFSYSEAVAWNELIEEAYSVIGSPNARRVYDTEKQRILLNKFHHPSTPEIIETPLPAGHHKTPISQYEVSKTMEELIEKQDVFDGLFLKKIREYKNIELPDFSNHTCIAIRHLYAIENNNFSVLPAAVFVRGYIIQYCRVLGLDETKVVSSFMALFNNDH
jgi:curved DNA-binding protein CbpA